MTFSIGRRSFLGHAGTALGLGVFAATGRAGAQPGDPGTLPAIGRTINLDLNGFGGTLIVDQPPPLPTLDFIGSRVVEVRKGGTDFVHLQTLNFTVEAAHPMFGKITARLPDIDTSQDSVLKLGPDGLVETWLQSMDVTFQRCGDCEGPFTFSTLEPARWTARLSQFPPPPQSTNPDGSPTGGTLYRLAEPIRLGLPGASDNTPDSPPVPDSPNEHQTSGACESCALASPLPGQSTTTGTEYARIQNLDFNQGHVPN
ncbi:hypothetical protein [Nocardia iowensis]|uniref:Twin-arginine translocation signal domain-containing protein n=1 Tax=Nocardia iowensis TaxID=204891 RepID=A0ABX8RXL5_NOCIO|nr:hypothetical protein [Nocardia iowensis]QXN94404.1 hypothetical protein KV110_15895 [Nocardia iowensis]